MQVKRILVVDDDPALLEMMRMSLSKEGFDVESAASCAEARRFIGNQSFEVVVSDIYLGDGTGIEVLNAAKMEDPAVRVILVTAQGSVETVAAAAAGGVFDYLAKPFQLDDFIRAVRTAFKGATHEVEPLNAGPESMMIGSHPKIVEVYKAVGRVAKLDVPVLIGGPTGSGKELIARALHRYGLNPEGPFVPINCGAIPENLIESELFGHHKGSFTGAVNDQLGAIESAAGGTLFLDEIGELSLTLQVKLLRFLQQGEIHPIGGRARVVHGVRIVAATHQKLPNLINAGAVREDFYYRLAGYEIEVPSLSERPSDIPLLVEHFRIQANERLIRNIEGASPATLKILEAYSWPGNIREMENLIIRTAIDFGTLADPDAFNCLLEPKAENEPRPDRVIGTDLTLAEVEKIHIEAILERTKGNRTQAASILGIERKSLYRKINRFGIDKNDGSGS